MKNTMVLIAAVAVFITPFAGCTKYKVETVHKIEVAPMHITIDINVKVDKALDDFFGDLDNAEGNLGQNK